MDTPLRRLGKKNPAVYLPYFPENITLFIDLFLGSGAMTCAAVDHFPYVIANDNDNDVYNLFMVWRDHHDELIEAITIMPQHQSLMQHWKTQEEDDPVWKAVRFVFRSNFSYMGHSGTLRVRSGNDKRILLDRLRDGFQHLTHVQFLCRDFRNALTQINFQQGDADRHRAFIFADPPYVGTKNNYAHSFTEQDSADLFDLLVHSGIRFLYCEFNHPFIVDQAEKYHLYVTEIGERRTLKNRQTEIIVTNYLPQRQLTLDEYLQGDNT